MADLRAHGPTLTLRLPRDEDAEDLLRFASDAEVTASFSWGPYRSVDEARAWLSTLPGERERGEKLDLAVVHRDDDAVVGVTGLSELSPRDRRGITGTWLGKPYWGTGVNAESKALLARIAFDALGFERLGSIANVKHLRSQAALAKLGFRREGVLRAWHRHGDVFHDVVAFSLLRSEWRRSPLARIETRLEGRPPPAFAPR